MDKARKWFVTRGDLDYTALWILYAATPLAKIEVLGAGLLVDREVLPQALKLNPAFFGTIYTNLLNTKKTRKHVEAALETAETFMARRAPEVFALVIDHLREVGEARSSTEIEAHFKRNFNIEGLTSACEYLSDLGLISKASIPVQLTKRSNISMEELAFAYRRVTEWQIRRWQTATPHPEAQSRCAARAYTILRTYQSRFRATSSL